MRRIYPLTGIFLYLLCLLSCTQSASNAPTVQIISPEIDSILDPHSELRVEIDISDDSMIKEYTFWLESDHGWEYYTDKKAVNKSSYKVMYTFEISSEMSNNFSVHIEAKDYDGNITHSQVDVAVE